MRLDLSSLKEDITLEVAGNEDWLAPIYKSFAHPDADQSQQIRGRLAVSILPDTDFVRVEGKIEYAPKVDCSRCASSIDWPLSASIDEYFQMGKDPTLDDRIVETALEDAPAAYLENGELDLEILLNDALQLAIPTQLIHRNEDGSRCLVCMRDLKNPVIVAQEPESKAEEKESPFSVLSGLKWES